MADNARVLLWGSDIGAVSWLEDRAVGVFQYTPEFADSGIEVAPLVMPLREAPYEFPALSNETFNGLPGMLADSLPDKFGKTLINTALLHRHAWHRGARVSARHSRCANSGARNRNRRARLSC